MNDDVQCVTKTKRSSSESFSRLQGGKHAGEEGKLWSSFLWVEQFYTERPIFFILQAAAESVYEVMRCADPGYVIY